MSHPVASRLAYVQPAAVAARPASDWSRFTDPQLPELQLPQGRDRPPFWQRLLCGCCGAQAVDAYRHRVGAAQDARVGWLAALRAQADAHMGPRWFEDAAVRTPLNVREARDLGRLMTMRPDELRHVPNGQLADLITAFRAGQGAYDGAAQALRGGRADGVVPGKLAQLVYAETQDAFADREVARRALDASRERLGEHSGDPQALARTLAQRKGAVMAATREKALASPRFDTVRRTAVRQALNEALQAEGLLPAPVAGDFAARMRVPAREKLLDASEAAEQGRAALDAAFRTVPQDALSPEMHSRIQKDFSRALERAVADSPSRRGIAPSTVDRLARRAVHLHVQATGLHVPGAVGLQREGVRRPLNL